MAELKQSKPLEPLKQGAHYHAFSKPKSVRDANPERTDEHTSLWIIQVYLTHYTILVLKPNGKYDAQRRKRISLEARLNNGQIIHVDDGHFVTCKI